MDAVVDSDASPIVLDLSAVTFLDSAAIGVILAARKRLALQRRDLRLAAPQPPVLRTLKVMGLHNVLAIHPTLAEACAEG